MSFFETGFITPELKQFHLEDKFALGSWWWGSDARNQRENGDSGPLAVGGLE
jgi:hypothetical protein